MKLKLHHILIIVTFMVSPVFMPSAQAQDSGMDDVEIVQSEVDKLLYSPGGEGETRYKAPALVAVYPKDSTAALPTLTSPRKPKTEVAKPVEKPNATKEDDDSILAFNFLYYIIQKYKLQDIVD